MDRYTEKDGREAPRRQARPSSERSDSARRSRQRSAPPKRRARPPTKRTKAKSARRPDARSENASTNGSSQRPERSPARRRRKSGSRAVIGRFFDSRFNVRLVTTLALVAAVILCCIIFFRVNTVSVAGNEKYTYDEIVAASGIEKSDALLLINKSSAASKIMAKLPYIDDVRIGTSFPSTVRIEVTELETAYAVMDETGTYWLINSQGRTVEPIDGKAAADYLTVTGVQVSVPEPGDTVRASDVETPQAEPGGDDAQTDGDDTADTDEDEEEQIDASTPKQKLAAALEILSYLDAEADSRAVTELDVSNLLDIRVRYGTQYEVLFGGATDLAYKVEYMTAAIAQLNEYETGTLDLTFAEKKIARFIPRQDQKS